MGVYPDRMIERWRQWRAGAQRRKTMRAVSSARRGSYWLAKRPFSDKYDGDSSGGGYFASGGSADLSPESERLKKRRNWR